MSVKIKNGSSNDEKGQVIKFNSEDFLAVKGLKGSFFEGKVKVLHKVQAEKLIKAKKAELSKDTEFEKVENTNRTVKDIK